MPVPAPHPTFVIIGAKRAATRWLRFNLDRHPDICAPPLHLDYFSDPDRKTLLAGGHETARKVWLSVDAGATWKDIGMNLPANTNHSSQPLVMNSQNFFKSAAEERGPHLRIVGIRFDDAAYFSPDRSQEFEIDIRC